MIFFKIKDEKVDPTKLKEFLFSKGIKAFISPSLEDSSRLVTHHYIRKAEI